MQASTGSTRSGEQETLAGRQKKTLFKTLVLSVLLFGCETWKLTKGEGKKLGIYQTKCLRKIFHFKWLQHVTNKEVLEMVGADPISEEVRKKRWCWIGHVPRKASEQRLSCCPSMEAGGEEEQRQTQNNLASGERQTRMEHIDKKKTDSKQPPAVEGRCPGLVRLLARRDLT